MLYTWNEYNIVYQFYISKKGGKVLLKGESKMK